MMLAEQAALVEVLFGERVPTVKRRRAGDVRSYGSSTTNGGASGRTSTA